MLLPSLPVDFNGDDTADISTDDTSAAFPAREFHQGPLEAFCFFSHENPRNLNLNLNSIRFAGVCSIVCARISAEQRDLNVRHSRKKTKQPNELKQKDYKPRVGC